MAFVAFGPIFVTFGLMLLAGVGFLWAPFAAYIAYRTARGQGLRSIRYPIAGAVYSALLLLPWLYMIANLRGWRFPIDAVLFILYAVWLLGPIGEALAIFIISSNYEQSASEASSYLRLLVLGIITLIA